MITWHTYDENTYKSTRYNLLYWVEEKGKPKSKPYLIKGDLTIGIGINLQPLSNLNAILTVMGFMIGDRDWPPAHP
jgi:hypothetical protein